MKAITHHLNIFFLCTILVAGISFSLSAQSKSRPSKGMDQTVSFKVMGNCGMCKERIESTALDVKGVKKAEWDIRTDMLVLTGTAKMNKQKVADALAKAGHKSELSAADPKGYSKLPGCCQYDHGIEKH